MREADKINGETCIQLEAKQRHKGEKKKRALYFYYSSMFTFALCVYTDQ